MKEKQYKTVDSSLPRNRFVQFGNIMRHHFFQVMLSSMYTLIFAVPLIFWLTFTSYLELFKDNYLFNILFVDGILIPCLVVFGIGNAGGLYFFKRLLFQEGSMINQDFFIGVKKNAKNFAKIYFFIGVFYLLLKISIGALNATEIENTWKIVITGVLYAFFILVIAMALFMQTETIFYEGGFFQLMKWAIRLVYPTLYKGIGIYLLILIPFFVVEFVPWLIGLFVTIAVCGVFYFGFSQLILMQFANHVYDLSVNKTQYPQNYRKGLAKETITIVTDANENKEA